MKEVKIIVEDEVEMNTKEVKIKVEEEVDMNARDDNKKEDKTNEKKKLNRM